MRLPPSPLPSKRHLSTRLPARAAPALSAALALLLLGSAGPSPVAPPAREAGAAARPDAGHEAAPDDSVELTLREGTNVAAALSPDGGRLAVDLLGSIWVLPSDGGEATRITGPTGDARQPDWSPEGGRIAFQSYRTGNWHVWTVRADGSDLRQLTHGPYDHREPHWSPDGQSLVLSSDRAGTYDVWRLDPATGELSRITSGGGNEFAPAASPDGGAVAYVADGEGESGVWIRPDGGPGRRLVASDGELAGPSWSPDGSRIVFNRIRGASSRLLSVPVPGRLAGADGTGAQPLVAPDRVRPVTGPDEDVFPFRAQWASADRILYTADGGVKESSVSDEGSPAEVPFRYDVAFSRDPYPRDARAFDGTGPREAMGIVGPVSSPSGDRVVFAALGDLWSLPVGGAPRRLTRDAHVDLDPDVSPAGGGIAWASDRAGTVDLWVRESATGRERRLTESPGAERHPAWGPEGRRIAFLDGEGTLRVVDVETGRIRTLHEDAHSTGAPTWSPDGSRIAVSALEPYSSRYREGTNQILVVPLDAGEPYRVDPLPHRSVGTRGTDGPVWSPDGEAMAFVLGGVLWRMPVTAEGRPAGAPVRLTSELADDPSWGADSRTITYQSAGRLRRVDVRDGSIDTIPVPLSWRREQRAGRVVVHAGRLFDGTSPDLRRDVDLVIRGHRIDRIVPHRPELHDGAREVVDASGRTVMPGLIEGHAHQPTGFGEVLGRIWLSYGVTSVRNPSSDAYESRERREAVEAGVRPGPRTFYTGQTFDGSRIYYSGSMALHGGARLEQELERAARMDYDMVKTYVRLEDRLQERVIEFAHEHGMPVSSHELYPAVAAAGDAVEHIRGTSRRGYSPKVSELYRSYGDMVRLLAHSGMSLTPTIGIYGGWSLALLREPDILEDERFTRLMPSEVREAARERLEQARGRRQELEALVPRMERTAAAVVDSGGRVVAGTDSPIIPPGVSLHTEIAEFVRGGMSEFEALRTATAVAAEVLGAGRDLGTLERGKLADLVVVAGNPLREISDSRAVRTVVKNGEVYTLDELLRRP